jgi:murein DD-endopeptidase MepM/ murein hydrolase activator NlpD
MEDVLYAGQGAPASVVALALRLFAHKLDLTRDLAIGDRVRLVIADDGDGLALDYAELDSARGPVRLYRVGPGVDDGAFVDETGADLRRLLLRTPVAHPRLTSGFGMRLHPLLGYSRMHQGLDFGVPVGTPVLAAGDGVVARAGAAGGYGQLMVLKHGVGLETRYAHLSAFAPLALGARVRQGEVIGWSGQSGLATGPHLHFEVRRKGEAVDPATATTLPAGPPSPAQAAAFAARRAWVDALLNGAPTRPLARHGPAG